MVEDWEIWDNKHISYYIEVENIKMAMSHINRARLFNHDPEVFDKLNLAEDALLSALLKLRDEYEGCASTGTTGERG